MYIRRFRSHSLPFVSVLLCCFNRTTSAKVLLLSDIDKLFDMFLSDFNKHKHFVRF